MQNRAQQGCRLLGFCRVCSFRLLLRSRDKISSTTDSTSTYHCHPTWPQAILRCKMRMRAHLIWGFHCTNAQTRERTGTTHVRRTPDTSFRAFPGRGLQNRAEGGRRTSTMEASITLHEEQRSQAGTTRKAEAPPGGRCRDFATALFCKGERGSPALEDCVTKVPGEQRRKQLSHCICPQSRACLSQVHSKQAGEGAVVSDARPDAARHQPTPGPQSACQGQGGRPAKKSHPPAAGPARAYIKVAVNL